MRGGALLRWLPRWRSPSLYAQVPLSDSLPHQAPSPSSFPSSSSSSSAVPFDFSSPAARRRLRFHLAFFGILTWAWVGLYLASLEGGTVQSLQEKLSRLGTDVVSAIALFTACIHLSAFSTSLRSYHVHTGANTSARGISLASIIQWTQLALLPLLYLHDHGSDLEHHGTYNLAIFFIIALPINAFLALVRVWWAAVLKSCSKTEEENKEVGYGLARTGKKNTPAIKQRATRKFLRQVAIISTSFGIWLYWQLSTYAELWSEGFFGESLVACQTDDLDPQQQQICAPKTCDWQQTTPWVDLIPSGSQNIWVNWPWARTCQPSGPRDFHAELRNGGELIVTGCPAGTLTEHTRLRRISPAATGNSSANAVAYQDSSNPLDRLLIEHLGTYPGAIYSEFPPTRTWSWDAKEMELSNAYQDNVLDYLANHTHFVGQFDSAGRPLPLLAAPRISENVETVLVKCGEHERMATRVVAKSEPERQAAPLSPSPDSASTSTSTPPSAGHEEKEEHPPLNLLVLFFDALSRRHFFRRLPKTATTLEAMSHSVSNVPSANPESAPPGWDLQMLPGSSYQNPDSAAGLSLVQFFRYLAVGYNTDPTTRSLLAGLSRHDLHTIARPIWKDFADAGYATGYAADNCQDWMTRYGSGRVSRTVQGVGKFTWDHAGPENRYGAMGQKVGALPPGAMAADHEFESFSCMPEFFPLLKSDRGNVHGPNAVGKRCIAGNHVHDLMFDYLRKFMDAYTGPSAPSATTAAKKEFESNSDGDGKQKQKPWFLMGSFMEAHEGSSEAIAMLDDSLSSFLDPRTTSIPLNNTAIFLVADHGLHMGLGRLYFNQGKVEERNPFGAVLLPDWAIDGLSRRATTAPPNPQREAVLPRHEAQPGHLSARQAARLDVAWNQQKLVTSFDLYQTFQHLLSFSTSRSSSSSSSSSSPTSSPSSGKAESGSQETLRGPRSGKSIFGGPLPDRTCDDVDVEDWLCRCRTREQGKLD